MKLSKTELLRLQEWAECAQAGQDLPWEEIDEQIEQKIEDALNSFEASDPNEPAKNEDL